MEQLRDLAKLLEAKLQLVRKAAGSGGAGGGGGGMGAMPGARLPPASGGRGGSDVLVL